MKVGSLIHHQLYPQSRGIIVETSETDNIVVYYLDLVNGNEMFRNEIKTSFVFIREMPRETVEKVIERFNLKRQRDELDQKISELKLELMDMVNSDLKG